MAKKEKGQIMVHMTQHRKLKTKQHEPVILGALEGYSFERFWWKEIHKALRTHAINNMLFSFYSKRNSSD